MQIEKGLLIRVLSRVKAWHSIVILRDSKEDGCFDIMYAAMPFRDVDAPVAINIMTIQAGGGLFGDAEKIGKSIRGYLVDIRDAINKADTACTIKDRQVNGCGIKPPLDKEIDIISELRARISRAVHLVRHSLNLSGSDFAAISSDCLSFAARDKDHTVLQGTYIDIKSDCLIAVSSDGIKLVKHEIFVQSTSSGKYIIPSDAMYIPSKTEHPDARIEFFDKLGSITMYFEDFKSNSVFRVIDMPYPDYERVIAKNAKGTESIEINAPCLLSRLKGVYAPTIKLVCEDGKIRAFAEATGNESEKDLGVIEGAVSHNMILAIRKDVLCAAMTDAGSLVKLALKDVNSALVWHSSDDKVTRLFMPISHIYNNGQDEWGYPIVKGTEAKDE